MTHTPGPWGYAARLSGSENHKGFGLWPATGGAIADIYPMDEDGIEGEANAQLIAAAPELLAALEKLLLYVTDPDLFEEEYGQPEFPDSSIICEAWLEAQVRGPARAAIAKTKETQ